MATITLLRNIKLQPQSTSNLDKALNKNNTMTYKKIDVDKELDKGIKVFKCIY